MDQFDCAIKAWRYQELAHFARHAHDRLGRGFVFVEGINSKPTYITQLFGAPASLLTAVYDYDPQHEALLVCEDPEDVMIISRVRIDEQH